MLEEEARSKIKRALAEGKIEWVSRTLKNGVPGFYRRTPFRESKAQLELQLRFSEISYNLFGLRGTADTPDGRRVQKNAQQVGKELAGQKFSTEKKLSH